jgi:alkylation response protein AidB-like acyl-CoA dehydrogenase
MTSPYALSTEEHEELQKVLRELFSTLCPPSLVRELKEPSSNGRPEQLWRALAEVGVFGLIVDQEFGGEGASLVELSLVFGEGGRVLCPTGVYTSLLFGLALGRIGTDAHKDIYLRRLAAGELLATTALWDPSDARRVRPALRAERATDGWRLSGELAFVSNGEQADVLLVSAQADDFLDSPRTLAFLVSPGGPGWSSESLTTMASDKQSRIRLDGYLVDHDQTLAGPADGGFSAADLGYIADAAVALQCAEMIGGASAVLDRTVSYVKAREQFGRPLASFQAVQHQVANIAIALEQTRVCTSQAISRLSRGVPAGRSVAIAKLLCSDMYKQATLTAHQLHGGMGYVRETDLHLWTERAKVAEVTGGSADVAASWLARDLRLAG